MAELPDRRTEPLTQSRRWSTQAAAAITACLVIWILVVAVNGVLMAGSLFGPPFAPEPIRSAASRDMIFAAVVVVATVAAIVLLTSYLRPSTTVVVATATPVGVMLLAAVATGQTGALFLVIALAGVAILVGNGLIALCGPAPPEVVRIPLAGTLGLGTLGLAWAILAQLQLLTAAWVTALTATLAALASAALWRRRADPVVPSLGGHVSPLNVLLLALSSGLIAFALLAAFVPENQSDATRQHLPIAREIWQTGTLGVFDPMSVSRQGVQNHVLFAVAWGLGGATGANLAQAITGIVTIYGVAAIGKLLAGRAASVVSVVLFATMPLVMWELGHAFVDLLPAMLAVGAMIAVLMWQQSGRALWLVYAGGLAGVGVASKLTMLLLAAAFLLGIALVGRGPWQPLRQLRALATFCVGALTAVPSLYRTYQLNGTIPGLEPLLARAQLLLPVLPSSTPTPSATLPSTLIPAATEYVDPALSAAVQQFGHAPSDLLGMPWFLTFQGKDLGFPVIGRGEIGVALLMLLPLVIFAPRTRATAMVGLVTLVSFIGWWATPFQIARHLLPTLALASALVGAGVAGLLARPAQTRLDQALVLATRGGLLLSLILVPFFFLPSSRTQMPISYLIGAESRQEYINRTIRSAVALQAATDFLPPDTPVLYYGGPWEAPQLYTEARLIFFPSHGMQDSNAVLWYFEQLTTSHFIWNRADSPELDWRSPTLSTPFLRQYTRILAGDNDAYLFEVLPEGTTTWGQASVTNLLEDPGLTDVKGNKGPWTVEGKSIVAQGVVALSRRATLTQEVAVTPRHTFLLEAPIRCLDASGHGILGFRWLDDTGAEIGTATEQVLPGQQVTDQFLWRIAPEGVAAVQAEFSMAGPGRCEFSGAALYDLGPAPGA